MRISIFCSVIIFFFISQSEASSVKTKVQCQLEGPIFEAKIEGPLTSSEWNLNCNKVIGEKYSTGVLTPRALNVFTLVFNGMKYNFNAGNLYVRANEPYTCDTVQADFLENGLSNYSSVNDGSNSGKANFRTDFRNFVLAADLGRIVDIYSVQWVTRDQKCDILPQSIYAKK
ncbi:MAG: hypothetical protein EOP04_23425 [Proteobacteria bacterium]|nr:MAG: hypothetical protein EOP04_23425 [Pseudomonadota bacterium]